MVFHKLCLSLSCSGELLDSEIKTTCIPDDSRNGAWRLNCSSETLEDGVVFSWGPYSMSDFPTFGSSVMELTSKDLDLEFTCTATNEASVASRTVTLNQVCGGKFFCV